MLEHLSKGNFAQVAAQVCRNAMHYTRAGGGGRVKLENRFTANTVTAVISATAEMGSHDHAE
jgi:signal transduction histidine kinase